MMLIRSRKQVQTIISTQVVLIPLVVGGYLIFPALEA
jgi:hypothetical protein